MPRPFARAFLAALLSASALFCHPEIAPAQATTPGLPGTPQPTPNYPSGPRLPQSAQGGSGNYSVSAAANQHGAFLWVVDNVQHAVVLCEKTGTQDFTCSKKPLP
jgi:hypothetical protein